VSELFRRIFPDHEEGLTAERVAEAIPPGEPPADRPFLALNMIATADGRATIAGRTGPIANRADYELFHALRTRVDAVLVGAETVRVEGYGPMEAKALVATRSLRLPADVGLLRSAGNEVYVLTPSPEGELPASAATVHYVREPDVAAGLRRLRAEHGVRSVLCEGGPDLNASLIAERMVDELHLVLASKLAGGADPLTILSGPALDPPVDLTLLSVHESGGYLFLRYGL
jgi:riboflavin biosynthesis pyrimidine reductase